MISVFVSYSHKDDALWDQLQVHLAMMERQGIIDVWHDRRIVAGEDFAGKIDAALDTAQVVLALVSPDFLNSDYCYDTEMTRALERHKAGEAKVIPVILRPCDWHPSPLGKLKATPKDGRPVTKAPNIDDAYLNIVQDIRAALNEVAPRDAAPIVEARKPKASAQMEGLEQDGPRSSNLRVRKTFTQADKDRFIRDTFDYMAKFFENSLAELARRNEGIETHFQRIDARRFTAIIYRDGNSVSGCKILTGSQLGAITYAQGIHSPDNSCNASLDVIETEQALFIKPSLDIFDEDKNLTMEGAAEHFWGKLMEPLQY